jgi:hypothetical protein
VHACCTIQSSSLQQARLALSMLPDHSPSSSYPWIQKQRMLPYINLSWYMYDAYTIYIGYTSPARNTLHAASHAIVGIPTPKVASTCLVAAICSHMHPIDMGALRLHYACL